MRTIELPAINRTVTLRQYVDAIRTAKANPDAIFKTGLSCWWSCTGAEIMRQFYQGMTDRINQEIPYTERGKYGGGSKKFGK
jgi:hypothetical protein